MRRHFNNVKGANTHTAIIHPKDFNLCSVCDVGFNSQKRLLNHRVAIHNICVTCSKSFGDKSALEIHSLEHSARHVLCPGRECNRCCKSAAGLVAHLESGACRSKFNREQINQIAVDLDKTNVITNPARLAQGPDGPAPPKRAITSLATSLSFNGKGFECSLCHREFVNLAALNSHIASSVHDEKIYRCPKEWKGCGKEYGALSVLCHHVEGQKCGIREFSDPMQQVIKTMSSALKGKLVL